MLLIVNSFLMTLYKASLEVDLCIITGLPATLVVRAKTQKIIFVLYFLRLSQLVRIRISIDAASEASISVVYS